MASACIESLGTSARTIPWSGKSSRASPAAVGEHASTPADVIVSRVLSAITDDMGPTIASTSASSSVSIAVRAVATVSPSSTGTRSTAPPNEPPASLIWSTACSVASEIDSRSRLADGGSITPIVSRPSLTGDSAIVDVVVAADAPRISPGLVVVRTRPTATVVTARRAVNRAVTVRRGTTGRHPRRRPIATAWRGSSEH